MVFDDDGVLLATRGVRTGEPELLGRKTGRRALAVDAADQMRLEALSQPDARAFVAALAAYLAVWVLGLGVVVWAQGQPLVQLLTGVLMGSQLHALTVLLHDCGHHSAFRSRRANLWVGRALSWFIILPFTSFAEIHRLHHSHLGTKRRDPEHWFYAAGPRWVYWRECLFMPRLVWLSLTWRVSPKARARVRAELAANLLGHAALDAALLLAGRPDVLLFAFVLPMLVLAWVVNPLSRAAEHAPLARTAPEDPRCQDIRFNTVTVANRALGLAWANINYHVEHHLYPRVPFYRLPELHEMLRGRSCLRTGALWPGAGVSGRAHKSPRHAPGVAVPEDRR